MVGIDSSVGLSIPESTLLLLSILGSTLLVLLILGSRLLGIESLAAGLLLLLGFDEGTF